MRQAKVKISVVHISIQCYIINNHSYIVALAIAEKACEAFPTSVDVWLKRIELVDNTQTQSESVMAEDQLFQTALNKNGASFKLWSAYVDWIEKKWQNDALKPDTVDELLTVSGAIQVQCD
jgi:hypothetical protein